MPTIVDFPTVVKDALAVFGDVFDTEAARRHFAEYLTGLMVAENKTVSGMNREFALTTDQSCLNRWLTEVQWDVTALHDRRLAWLQQAPQTRYSVRGVIAIENTLVDHAGKRIEHVNSSVKRCRVAKDRIRLWKAGVRDLVMELCCALHNFRVRLTPWQPMV